MQNTISFTAPQQDPLAFVREGFVTFNPAQANFVLERCRYERQRDEDRAKSHIAALAEQMRRGLWLPKTQIDFARLGDRLILVNGHHRLWAQVLSGADVVWSVVFHDCANDDDVKALYPRFDTILRKRTTENVLRGIGFVEASGLTKTTATALWNASTILSNGLAMSTRVSAVLLPDDRQAVALKYADEALIAEGYLALAPRVIAHRLRSPGRFSVMVATIKYRPALAADFWAGLCNDDQLAKGDPRKTLITDMMTRSVQNGVLAANMMAAARAWNAFYRGEKANLLRVNGNPIPLSGTPFTVRA